MFPARAYPSCKSKATIADKCTNVSRNVHTNRTKSVRLLKSVQKLYKAVHRGDKTSVVFVYYKHKYLKMCRPLLSRQFGEIRAGFFGCFFLYFLWNSCRYCFICVSVVVVAFMCCTWFKVFTRSFTKKLGETFSRLEFLCVGLVAACILNVKISRKQYFRKKTVTIWISKDKIFWKPWNLTGTRVLETCLKA